jgi:adenylate cyclase
MAIKDLISEIESDVSDVLKTGFEYINTSNVPNRSDNQLTFERDVAKRGKILKTCVLFVDIRNSVSLTEKHTTQTMGRIYTAFTKAVIKAAKHHNGHIRNIIGDRVMVVFPAENCFTNAVDCAITINHIGQNVINAQFKGVDFRCGIGIDHGELKIIKVGVQRRGQEATENRSLVWVGYPANIASRLTDMANKTIEETIFKVVRNPINPARRWPFLLGSNIFGARSRPAANEPYYLSTTETVTMTAEEFANDISTVSDGKLFMLGGDFRSFSKETVSYSYPPILLTEAVYEGFRKANPERPSIKGNLWVAQKHTIKNVNGKVYGGNVTWVLK